MLTETHELTPSRLSDDASDPLRQTGSEAQGAYRALAEHLAEEVLLTVKEVQERLDDAELADALAASSWRTEPAAHEASRLAVGGLGGAAAPKPALRIDIVANMKARYPTVERRAMAGTSGEERAVGARCLAMGKTRPWEVA